MIINDQPEYKVKSIIGKQKHHNQTQYLVKWKEYDSHKNSWEPASHLTNAKTLISEYNSQLTTIHILIITISHQSNLEAKSYKKGDRFNGFHHQFLIDLT